MYNGLTMATMFKQCLFNIQGCRELVDPFINHPAPWSAKRISDYGITELHVMNKTHIRIQQRSTHNVTDLQTYGKIVDSILLVKERHGKEAWF